PDEQVGSVNIDYVAAVEEATRQLIESGNKRVALATGSLTHPINGQFRLKGYKQALEKAGVAYDESLIFENE
ncbi:catabolite control protein A, partial [Paenibacillus polymyxa]|nr:catabolite control protein A [Paenibacillus polymyxa]